jgi:hypothetical protein
VCRDGDIGNGDDLGSITAFRIERGGYRVVQRVLSIGGVWGLAVL